MKPFVAEIVDKGLKVDSRRRVPHACNDLGLLRGRQEVANESKPEAAAGARDKVSMRHGCELVGLEKEGGERKKESSEAWGTEGGRGVRVSGGLLILLTLSGLRTLRRSTKTQKPQAR